MFFMLHTVNLFCFLPSSGQLSGPAGKMSVNAVMLSFVSSLWIVLSRIRVNNR